MKYLAFYLIFFVSVNLKAQTNSLSSFSSIIQNPAKIEQEWQTLQNTRNIPNVNHKYLQLHSEKLSKLENLFKSKKLKSNIEKLSDLTKKFQWKKTLVKINNIQVVCQIELQRPDECLSSIDELRSFIESQDLIIEKQEYFLNILDSTEDSAYEYALFFKDFEFYFNEEVNLINSELNKITTSNKKTQVSPLSNKFVIIFTCLFLIPVFWIITKKYPQIMFLYKAKRWLNKLQKETETDLSLISKNLYSIYPLINIIENEFKNAQISIFSNDFFTTLKIQIPSKNSFYYDLDNKKYSSLRKCILNLQKKVNPKDRIHLSDVYDPKGNINNQFIKINLAKI